MNNKAYHMLPFSLPEIDENSALAHFDYEPDIYMEILTKYYNNGSNSISQLEQSMQENDMENYRIYAHALKGNSSTIGALSMSEHAKKHEFAAKEGNIDFIRQDFSSLIEEYSMLLKKLEPYIKHTELKTTSNSIKISVKELNNKINNSINYLDNFEIDNALSILKNLLNYEISSEMLMLINDAIFQIEDFEYDKATDKLKILIN